MGNKEILLVVDVVSNEKEIDKEIIFQAIESALEAATTKRMRGQVKARVEIDRETGDYFTYRCWEVVESDPEFVGGLESPDNQILLEEANKKNTELTVGDVYEESIESIEFGRIAAQTAKQVIVQKVNEAERLKVVKAFSGRIGELVTGVVKRIEKGNFYIDLGSNIEAFIAKEEMIPREAVRMGDRIRGYLKDVRSEVRGPQLFVSRTDPALLTALFKLEVPEVGEELIEIKAAARDPGSRAKIAIASNDPRLDPVGACVGMRGSRVQAVSNELAGERVDIILWSDNDAQFVINSMSPAEIASIVVDEDSHSMDVAVAPDNLSQAIGRGGQNVRLATELTGWELNVIDASEAEKNSESEAVKAKQSFMEQISVDEEIADILVDEGFNSIEEIAYIPVSEMLQIEDFDEEIVEELRNRAKDALLINAIASEERLEEVKPAQDLLEMEGMDADLAYKLAAKNIVTMDDLADQSIDELLEVEGIDEERAGKLIMKAREPWFAE